MSYTSEAERYIIELEKEYDVLELEIRIKTNELQAIRLDIDRRWLEIAKKGG